MSKNFMKATLHAVFDKPVENSNYFVLATCQTLKEPEPGKDVIISCYVKEGFGLTATNEMELVKLLKKLQDQGLRTVEFASMKDQNYINLDHICGTHGLTIKWKSWELHLNRNLV